MKRKNPQKTFYAKHKRFRSESNERPWDAIWIKRSVRSTLKWVCDMRYVTIHWAMKTRLPANNHRSAIALKEELWHLVRQWKQYWGEQMKRDDPTNTFCPHKCLHLLHTSFDDRRSKWRQICGVERFFRVLIPVNRRTRIVQSKVQSLLYDTNLNQTSREGYSEVCFPLKLLRSSANIWRLQFSRWVMVCLKPPGVISFVTPALIWIFPCFDARLLCLLPQYAYFWCLQKLDARKLIWKAVRTHSTNTIHVISRAKVKITLRTAELNHLQHSFVLGMNFCWESTATIHYKKKFGPKVQDSFLWHTVLRSTKATVR